MRALVTLGMALAISTASAGTPSMEHPPVDEASACGTVAVLSADEMNRLGIQFASGEGMPEDFGCAMSLFSRAAQSGHAGAQTNIGMLLLYGFGVPADPSAAAEWFERGASAGDISALNYMGLMSATGVGVARNDEQAFDMFSQAAVRGFAPAMANLGRLYARGNQAASNDLMAYAWMLAAMKRGLDGDALGELWEALDIVGSRMDAKAISEAEDMANWIDSQWTSDALPDPRRDAVQL